MINRYHVFIVSRNNILVIFIYITGGIPEKKNLCYKFRKTFINTQRKTIPFIFRLLSSGKKAKLVFNTL